MDDAESLIDEHRLAEILGVSTSTLAKWRHDGDGPAFIRVGSKSARYAMPDVRKWIEEHRRK
jgi:predicted DNA-binding transcriptional regulator AlpA